MKELINEKLDEIAFQKRINILFAIESGSRAWGMESSDSDYDVRFVYYYPIREYLRLNSPDDLIQKSYDKEGIPMKQEGCFIDIEGKDIFRYMELIKKSNPTCIEWAINEELYLGEQPELLKLWIRDNFNPKALYWHYKSMAKANYRKYIENGNDITHKRYLYVLRGLINARFVTQRGFIPPLRFEKTITRTEIPYQVYKRTFEIIEIKKSGNEKDQIERIPELDFFIEQELDRKDDEPDSRKPNNVIPLDDVIWRILNE